MEQSWEPSELLAELIDLAFQHTAESVCEGDTLVPFVLHERDGHVSIERCMVTVGGGDSGEEEGWDPGPSAEKAKARAREAGSTRSAERASRVIAAYDGYVRKRDGSRLDAIILEVFEDGAAVTALLAQAYSPPTEDEEFCLVNDPMILGTIDPMW